MKVWRRIKESKGKQKNVLKSNPSYLVVVVLMVFTKELMTYGM